MKRLEASSTVVRRKLSRKWKTYSPRSLRKLSNHQKKSSPTSLEKVIKIINQKIQRWRTIKDGILLKSKKMTFSLLILLRQTTTSPNHNLRLLIKKLPLHMKLQKFLHKRVSVSLMTTKTCLNNHLQFLNLLVTTTCLEMISLWESIFLHPLLQLHHHKLQLQANLKTLLKAEEVK